MGGWEVDGELPVEAYEGEHDEQSKAKRIVDATHTQALGRAGASQRQSPSPSSFATLLSTRSCMFMTRPAEELGPGQPVPSLL